MLNKKKMTSSIKFLAPDVSSVLIIISPNNVREKKNRNMLNASYAMITIQQTTKDAPSTKSYRRKPSHPYEPSRTETTRMCYSTHKSDLVFPTLLLSHLNPTNMKLAPHKSISYKQVSTNRNCQPVTYKN